MTAPHFDQSLSQESLCNKQVVEAAQHESVRKVQIRSPYRTVSESAEYLRFSVKAFRHWTKRQGIVPYRRGRVLLYRLQDLDDALVGGYSVAKAIARRFPKLVVRKGDGR